MASGLFTAAALSLFLGGAVAVSYLKQVSSGLPDLRPLETWKPAEGTEVTAMDGSPIGGFEEQKREFVPLSGIPRLVVDAFVSAEDGKYWTHGGVDPAAVARAALANLSKDKGRPEGASTITQQVIKNLMLSPERTLSRKVREALLAIRADREIGKDRMLEIYLNEIYLGAGSYGVAAAARTYFGKPLADLSVSEAALLAGMPKAPSAANPFVAPQKARARRDYVLGRMLEEGYVAERDYRNALAEPLPTAPDMAEDDDPAFGYPRESIRKQLLARLGHDGLYGSGGTVRSTLDPALQAAVHRQLRKGLVAADRKSGWHGTLARGVPLPPDWSSPALAVPPGAESWRVGVVAEAGRDARVLIPGGEVTVTGKSLAWASPSRRASAVLAAGDAILLDGDEAVQMPRAQGAAVVLDPDNGAVLAMDGGFSFQTSEFNRADQARRQTGSSFKPFVYLAALGMGYDATSPVLDAPISLDQGGGKGDWKPQNGAGGLGLITLRKSLELSRNMSTVRLLYDIGMEPVETAAHAAGFPFPPSPGYATALGTAEATPLELAASYAFLANGGHPVRPTLFADEARDVTGDPPAFDPVAIAQLSSILEGVPRVGTASAAFRGFPHRVAAKTGTTNESKDAWLAAYGPGFVTVVWVGHDDGSPLSKDSSGGNVAAPIARGILDEAESIIRFEDFTLPEGATTLRVDHETGTPDETGDLVEIMRQGEANGR